MKALKKKLKVLSWRNGNVFERAEELRKKVKESQIEVDRLPHDAKVKEKSCMILKEYQEAVQDEYSLLSQKAKVEWLNKGDRNTAYFYKTLKERMHIGRIMTIRNERRGKLRGEVNATLISLVPKSSTPGKVSYLRPIACCNRMVYWIMTCVTTAKLSININGERVGYFKGGRRLRQGDPISPYLFTLVMEVLNLIIRNNIEENVEFKYHYGCKKLEITHLCFAEDILVFCHGDCKSVRIIKNSLDEFSSFSGLMPNMKKSTVFFGGLSSAEQQNILNIIPFSIGKILVRNKDTIVWLASNGQEQKFKISNVWKERVNNDSKVDWYSMDKLTVWRPNEDFKCVLCNKCSDSHNHLFFTCEFSKEVWNELLKKLNVSLSRSWDQIIDEIKDLPANRNIWSIVRRLVCGAAVYYIWQERNNRLFRNEKRESKTVLNIAMEAVVMKLIGLKVKDSTVKEVEERWNVKMQRFLGEY
ncbi:RNA-directed DNA polymerase, eukaryota, reverse transcriptase zinc-binding domain protein [Tanacetum coccineum]